MPKRVSSVLRKNLMAATGLFLCLFIVIHCLGNLVLFLPEGSARDRFNAYADFLSHQKLISVAAYLTYLSVLIHAVLSVVLTVKNRQSAGQRYQVSDPGSMSPWYTRSMGALGSILLVFLIVHLTDFWYPFKFGSDVALDDQGRRDLYSMVTSAFSQLWRVLLYCAGMFALAFHLYQGMYNGFRSLGLHHPKFSAQLKQFSKVFAITIATLFALMPVVLFVRHLIEESV